MEHLTVIILLIFVLIFSGILLVATNGISDSKSFGSRITQKDYPIFVDVFILMLVVTAIYLLFFWKV